MEKPEATQSRDAEIRSLSVRRLELIEQEAKSRLELTQINLRLRSLLGSDK